MSSRQPEGEIKGDSGVSRDERDEGFPGFPIVPHASRDGLGQGANLWRHMDLYKFIDLLQTSELHFPNAEAMEDQWEGVLPESGHSDRESFFGDGWKKMQPFFNAAEEYVRTHLYLNCWYHGKNESLAMWRLYSMQGKGIAIKTTKKRLLSSLSDDRLVASAPVEYVDYETHQLQDRNLSTPYLLKRRSFEFEREYRLLAYAKANEVAVPPPHVRVKVDLPQLVDTVYVSPDTELWAVRVIANLTKTYLQDVDVVHSSLLLKPTIRGGSTA